MDNYVFDRTSSKIVLSENFVLVLEVNERGERNKCIIPHNTNCISQITRYEICVWKHYANFT